MTLGSYLWNCLRSQEHRVLSHHLCHFAHTPLGKTRNLLPTSERAVREMPHLSLTPRPRGLCVDLSFVQGFRCSPQSTCLAVLCGREGKEHCPSQQRLGREGLQCPPPPPTPGRPPGWAWSTTAHAGRIHHCLHSGETVNNREGSAVHPTHRKTHQQVLLFFCFGHTA